MITIGKTSNYFFESLRYSLRQCESEAVCACSRKLMCDCENEAVCVCELGKQLYLSQQSVKSVLVMPH